MLCPGPVILRYGSSSSDDLRRLIAVDGKILDVEFADVGVARVLVEAIKSEETVAERFAAQWALLENRPAQARLRHVVNYLLDKPLDYSNEDE